MVASFPPRPAPGCRVWSGSGYSDHGRMEGPKVDIPPGIGGIIVSAEKPYMTMDFLLYYVEWDNGQASKHYFKDLHCIGRFASPAEFEASIELIAARATFGPNGGFRCAEVSVRYEGVEQVSEIYKDDCFLWRKIEAMAKGLGVEIEAVALPVKWTPPLPSRPSVLSGDSRLASSRNPSEARSKPRPGSTRP